MNIPQDKPTIVKWVKRGLMGAFVLAAGWSSFYTVKQTDKANVTMFGKAQYDTPVGPGLHFKVPFMTSVDRIQTSLTTLHIPPFTVNTVDNQIITLDLNFNYTIPSDKVNHLLYEIGRTGSTDINESIIPVVKDRASAVFNKQNTTTVSMNRDQIQAEVTKDVFETLRKQFGIEPHTLQFAGIGYSDSFVKSNELAVTAKNDAIKEQNNLVKETALAQQKVIKAKADADAAIEAARGQSQSVLLNAQADKTKQELDGQGQSTRLKAEISVFGSPSLYIEYMKASAGLLWDGKTPQVVSGNGGGSTVVVPVPGLK
jgi:regulator of protease activity HflC (stomatin/prohibitin superfamily)